jgi:hypothetical protein
MIEKSWTFYVSTFSFSSSLLLCLFWSVGISPLPRYRYYYYLLITYLYYYYFLFSQDLYSVGSTPDISKRERVDDEFNIKSFYFFRCSSLSK